MSMGFRLLTALAVWGGLVSLVLLQMHFAEKDGYLTVEQLADSGKRALSFDRHYAMPFDFCLFPMMVVLIILFAGGQWHSFAQAALTATGSVIAIYICIYFLWIGGNEAHVHDRVPTVAGHLHGVYAAIVVWAMIMLLCFTPKPDPMLLVMICIAIPIFFFVGTHMYLGLINLGGAATTYNGNPLKDPVGWSVIIVATALVWWRSYMLIPTEWWQQFN